MIDVHPHMYLKVVYFYLVIKMARILDQIRVDEVNALLNVSNEDRKQEWDMISNFKSENESTA